jgi:hypothetical protein
MAEDVLSQLQRLLQAASPLGYGQNQLNPRQAVPNLPTAATQPTGVTGMSGAANLQMPAPGAAPLQAGDWDALIRLLRDSGVAPSQPAQPYSIPGLDVQGGMVGQWGRKPQSTGWQASMRYPVQF